MTFEEFDMVQTRLFTDCVRMKDTKGKEYANSESRFANFDRLSATLKMDRKKILAVYLQKHLDAINSFISTGQTFSDEGIHGRIVDAVTYLSLLDGMIEEEKS